MKIQLHIERLILDGLPVERREGSVVQAAIETELARLISTAGLAPALLSGGAMPASPGGSIQLTSQSKPAQMGAQIAQAVYGGLGNE
jgi:hypothetical protein